jgi:hypothetical protein
MIISTIPNLGGPTTPNLSTIPNLPVYTYDIPPGVKVRYPDEHMPRDLKDILGVDAGKFTLFPSTMRVKTNDTSRSIRDILDEVKNIRYIEYQGWLAVSPEIGSAVTLYISGGSGYAGLSLVEFLNNVAAGWAPEENGSTNK